MSQGAQDIDAQEPKSKAPLARVAGELLAMSAWKKKLLTFFLLIAAIGAVLRVPAWLDRQEPQVETPTATEGGTADHPAPPGARGFVDSSRPARTDQTETHPGPPSAQERDLPWTADLGGWLARLGLSFAAGMVLGVFFRAFLKTMAAVTAVVVAGLVVLSYFEVIGIDLSIMRQNYDSFAGWASAQAYGLRDFATGILPSFGAGIVGFFFGFIRR